MRLENMLMFYKFSFQEIIMLINIMLVKQKHAFDLIQHGTNDGNGLENFLE